MHYHQSISNAFRSVMTLLVAVVLTNSTSAQEETAPPSGLSLEQERLASRFERLEAVTARLAELAESKEPERAEQLRRTLKTSREKGLSDRFTTIVKLLETERLSAAAKDQTDLQTELEELLQVLLEDPGNSERDAMKKFLKAQIRELGKLIREERSLRNQNEEGSDSERIASQQQDVNEDAKKVEQALDQESKAGEPSGSEAPPSGESPPQEGKPSESKPSEGKPSEGKPSQGQPSEGEPSEGEGEPGEASDESQESSDPLQQAAKRVAKARRAMQEAEQKLHKAEREGARQDQREAQRELEAARAELERILRQLREEEMEQLLAKLAARFRDMLAAQRSIYDDTVSVDKEIRASASRNLMLSAIKLSRREAELVRDAEKAAILLREDGTSVAFPETVQQLVEDMQSITVRLAAADVGPITQTIELDTIAGLEDMIAALDQARDELSQKQGESPPPGGGGGEPGESPLVTKIAELKMIRTLQARVYKRTQDLGALLENPQVDRSQLDIELKKLTERQQRVFQATRDLDTDANQ